MTKLFETYIRTYEHAPWDATAKFTQAEELQSIGQFACRLYGMIAWAASTGFTTIPESIAHCRGNTPEWSHQ